jgi:hypothetical protein
LKRAAQRRKKQLDLNGAPPFATPIANDVTGAGHHQQEGARHEHGRRMEDRAARDMHFHRPSRVARRRYGDERFAIRIASW